MALGSVQLFPCFVEWERIYVNVRDRCAFAEALDFVCGHPGTINNRGGRSRCTLLHQAVFWGVDAGVIGKLKDLGADPTILDAQGRAPLDLARGAGKTQEMEAIFLDAFGPDDGRLRQLTLEAAKQGNFLKVMQNLRMRPHLVNTQNPHTGWSVMHQVAFHGGSMGLVAALSGLGASWDLRTAAGKTPAVILEEMHPGSQLALPGRDVPVSLGAGTQALLHSMEGAVQGLVESVSDHHAVLRTVGGASVAAPLWRFSPINASLTDTGIQGAAGVPCAICSEPVPPQGKLSPACSGGDHPMCGECMVTFLWSQFTTPRLPIRCSCNAMVDLSNLPAVIGRSLLWAWPPGHSSSHPCTTISWSEFVNNVQRKIEEGEHVENDVHKLRLLQQSEPIVLAYCGASAPGVRACPACGVLISYGGACKHFACTMCEHRFCWLCLRTRTEHNDADFNWSISHTCPLEPVQTTIPHP
mmetsp:Transcript_107779/g.300415  ORF Transcript_107779/g.300415 Transcript_107779/m.300415 type:complete len:469 (-) Transcript_107779:208-1614(-)